MRALIILALFGLPARAAWFAGTARMTTPIAFDKYDS